MRQILFLLALGMLFQNCKSLSKETLIYDGKKYELEKPSERIKIINLLNNIVSSSSVLKPNLTDFKILESVDFATKEEYTYLLSTDEKKLHKLAILLVRNDAKRTYEIQEKRFAVCFGSTDCSPSLYNNDWGCDTKNIDNFDNFDCKKSVTIITE